MRPAPGAEACTLKDDPRYIANLLELIAQLQCLILVIFEEDMQIDSIVSALFKVIYSFPLL